MRREELENMKSFFSNKIDREELKLGDHIYSWRTAYIYAHHGIYVGDGNVIHFTGTKSGWILFSKSSRSNTAAICERCGGQSRFHGVIMSCLDCFLAGGNLYRFNYAFSPVIFFSRARGGTCTLAASDPSDDVLHRARYLLNNGFGDYSLFEKNCEDFALYCKTGVHVGSGQIQELRDAFAYSSLMARVGLYSF